MIKVWFHIHGSSYECYRDLPFLPQPRQQVQMGDGYFEVHESRLEIPLSDTELPRGEVDRNLHAFYITASPSNKALAIPITNLRAERAPWHDPKKSPKELWESVTTVEDRVNMRMLCSSSDMLGLLHKLIQGADPQAVIAEACNLTDYIEKEEV